MIFAKRYQHEGHATCFIDWRDNMKNLNTGKSRNNNESKREALRELTRAELEQLSVKGGLNPRPEEVPM